MVTPYNQKDSKKSQVREMFNNIAGKYDLLNRVLSLGIDQRWRKIAIKGLELPSDSYVLDMATGTADFAIMIKKLWPKARILGVDIATKMLDIGRIKIEKKGWTNSIELKEGDAEKISNLDNTFDAATVAFGVRNFEDLKGGLSEIHRVLKNEGKLVILEFSKPSMFPFRQIYHLYFKYVLPMVGKLTSKDPKAYKYLFESVQSFPNGKDFVSLLQQVGFKNCECKELTLGICSIYTGLK